MSLSAPSAMSASDNGALAISTPRYLAPSSSFVAGNSGRANVLPPWSPPMYLSDRDDGARFVTSESIHGSSPESALDHTCVPTSMFVRFVPSIRCCCCCCCCCEIAVSSGLTYDGNDGFFFSRLDGNKMPRETIDRANNRAIRTLRRARLFRARLLTTCSLTMRVVAECALKHDLAKYSECCSLPRKLIPTAQP